MIGQIGRLVLIESCRQMVAWQLRFGPEAPRVMCVNISGRQLAHVDLANDIERILRDALRRVPSSTLEHRERSPLEHPLEPLGLSIRTSDEPFYTATDINHCNKNRLFTRHSQAIT